MKQPSSFHGNDMAQLFVDSSDDDRSYVMHNNPIGPAFDAMQKQRAKQRTRLPKNNISDPMRVTIYNFINLPGVHAMPAKRVITLLSNEDENDRKVLSNM